MKKNTLYRYIVRACAIMVVSSLAIISTSTYAEKENNQLSHRLKIAKKYHELKSKTNKGKKISVIVKAATNNRGVKPNRLGANSILRIKGVKTKKTFSRWGLMELEVDSDSLDELIDSGEFELVKENAGYELQLLESTEKINAIEAHSSGNFGWGTSVAVIDSGVDTSHPFFGGRIAGEACFSNQDPEQGDYSTCPNGQNSQVGEGAGVPCENVYNACDHGTHVAGIVAGFAGDAGERGVAPGANIVPINIVTRQLCPDGVYDICPMIYETNVIEALNWVLENAEAMNIAAVNMSFAMAGSSSVCDDHILAGPINDLRDAGIAVIAASGNGGSSEKISAPACISSVISVGSTSDNSDTISNFSNSARILDLLAPGSNITSSIRNGEYQANGGTSMAAPHVAGAFAVMRAAAGDDANIDYLQQVVEAYGAQVLDPRNEIITPRVDLFASVNAVLNSSCTSAPATPDMPSVIATTGSSVLVEWNSVADADLYTIQTWDFNAAKWTDDASTQYTARAITGLASGPQYFRVRSVNSCGESDYNFWGFASL